MSDSPNRSTVNDSMLFNPFELNKREKNHNYLDFDPDSNFLSDNLPYSSEYYNEIRFNHLSEAFPVECKLFSVLHLNVRSLPNYDQLVHYLSLLNHEFSVIVLTETWLTKESKETGMYGITSTDNE